MVLIGKSRGNGSSIGKYSAIRAGPAVSTAQCEARNTASWMRVRHEQDGLAAFAPDPQHFEVHLFAGQRIERAERLVHQDQFWIVDEGARDRGALLHAAGQLLRIFVFVAGEPDQIEQIAGAGPRGLHRQADDFGRQQHVVQNGSPFQQQRLLEHHADIAGGIERCFRVADLDGAAVGIMQPGQDLQHRGLAAAGGADQRDQLAFLHVHGDVGDGEEFRALGPIDLADVAQADEGLFGAHASHFCKIGFHEGVVGEVGMLAADAVDLAASGRG